MDFPAEVLLREPSNDPQSLPDSSGRLSSKATFTNVHHHTSFFSVVHGSKPRMSSYWLVVWTWYFSIYWEGHNPNWRFVIFSRGVGIPPTSNPLVFNWWDIQKEVWTSKTVAPIDIYIWFLCGKSSPKWWPNYEKWSVKYFLIYPDTYRYIWILRIYT